MIIEYECACPVCNCKKVAFADLPAKPQFSLCGKCWEQHGKKAVDKMNGYEIK